MLVFALLAFCLSASAEAQVVYSGVFRAGSGGSGAWVGQEWAPFLIFFARRDLTDNRWSPCSAAEHP